MKIVLINTFETTGGAAIAASRLQEALIAQGEEVTLVVRDKSTQNPSVYSVNKNRWNKLINKLRFVGERGCIFLLNHCNKKNLFQVSLGNTGTNITSLKVIQEADIIHLHWFNQGFLSLEDLKALQKLNKPVIWTMHDMWAATGYCHYARDCKNYFTDCRRCPLTATPSIAASLYKQKKTLYKQLPLSIITCSKWLKKAAQKSALLKEIPIDSIPNPINTVIYKPLSKKKSRSSFQLPQDKYILFFGAAKINDERKGFKYLQQAIKQLLIKEPQIKEKLELLVLGKLEQDITNLFPIPTHIIPYIEEKQKIIQLYNCADIFVISSLEDNLPNMVMEAMACGVPCVGFEVGGIPEMIDHQKNGYIANYKDVNDLTNGINWVLNNKEKIPLSRNARQKVEENYKDSIVAQKFIHYYKKRLS